MKSNGVLFVCTGNTYRSVLAKNAFEHFVRTQTTENWIVDSAGITARPDTVRQCMIDFLAEKGVRLQHEQTKLECQMLANYSHVIAMAQNHTDFMEEQCGFFDAKLFNELAVGEKSSIWDVGDTVPDALTNEDAVCAEVRRTAEYIFDSVPAVFERIKQ